MGDLAHYTALAALFDYPTRDYQARIGSARVALGDRYLRAAEALQVFANALPWQDEECTDENLCELQEIFTRSFDVQAITTLSVGYIAFGDDYKRGELLVNLNREMRAARVPCGSELPDHLPNVLRLMTRWQDSALVTEFVEEILHPAVSRMVAEFRPNRMTERNKLYKKHFKTLIVSSSSRATMFRLPLEALMHVLEIDFELAAPERDERENDFLQSVARELEIEATEGRPVQSRSML